MSKWEFILNNPEWISVFASAVFAAFTIIVIVWQVFVMKAQVRVMVWQGRNSAKHERIQDRLSRSQNRLLRLQLEHERIQILNAERSQLLKLARKLHLAVTGLKGIPLAGDEKNWEEVQDTVYELNDRLSVLDVDAYDGTYDQWFFHLKEYVEAVLDAVIHDSDYSQETSAAQETIDALHRATKKCNPIGTFLEIETAIRMEFFEFKEKWDAETSETT